MAKGVCRKSSLREKAGSPRTLISPFGAEPKRGADASDGASILSSDLMFCYWVAEREPRAWMCHSSFPIATQEREGEVDGWVDGSIDSDTDAMAGDMCVRCLLPVHGMQVQALNARGRKRRASWLGVGVALSFYCARRGGGLRNGDEGVGEWDARESEYTTARYE